MLTIRIGYTNLNVCLYGKRNAWVFLEVYLNRIIKLKNENSDAFI